MIPVRSGWTASPTISAPRASHRAPTDGAASSACPSGCATRSSATSTSREHTGRFSAEDEELTTAIATTAGVAIANARLYAVRPPATANGFTPRPTITRQAPVRGRGRPAAADRRQRPGDRRRGPGHRRPAGRRRRETSTMRVAVAVGRRRTVTGRHFPVDGSLTGQVLRTGEPLLASRAANPRARVGRPGRSRHRPDPDRPAARHAARPRRAHRRPPPAGAAFTTADLDMAADSPTRPPSAIELADARAEQQRAACSTSATASPPTCTTTSSSSCSPPDCPCRASPSRSVPADGQEPHPGHGLGSGRHDPADPHHDLRAPSHGGHRRRHRARSCSTWLPSKRRRWVSRRATRFAGVLDTLPADITDDLVAVLREALANIARHAAARTRPRSTSPPTRPARPHGGRRRARASGRRAGAADWRTCNAGPSAGVARSHWRPAGRAAPSSAGRSHSRSPTAAHHRRPGSAAEGARTPPCFGADRSRRRPLMICRLMEIVWASWSSTHGSDNSSASSASRSGVDDLVRLAHPEHGPAGPGPGIDLVHLEADDGMPGRGSQLAAVRGAEDDLFAVEEVVDRLRGRQRPIGEDHPADRNGREQLQTLLLAQLDQLAWHRHLQRSFRRSPCRTALSAPQPAPRRHR